MDTPKAFISYSWDDEPHKSWVRALATRLRQDGVDVTLDYWHVQPGDQLPIFMEKAIRENDFVLITCTPKYKARSESRKGGVGYEGDIIQAEVFVKNNHRKFIPILRTGTWIEAAPSQLQGKAYIDLSGSVSYQEQYAELLRTLHGRTELPPEIGEAPGFSTRPNRTERSWNLKGARKAVNAVAITPDGSIAAAVDDQGYLRAWSTNTAQCINTTVVEDGYSVYCVAVSSDARQILSGHSLLKLYPITGDRGPHVFEDSDSGFWSTNLHYVTAAVVSADWSTVVSRTTRGWLNIWNVETGLKRRLIKAHSAYSGPDKALATTSDARIVVSASDSALKVWDGSDGHEIRMLRLDDNWLSAAGKGRFFTTVAISADGSLIVSGHEDGSLRTWNYKTGEQTLGWSGHTSRVNALALVPDGSLAVSASSDTTIKLWQPRTGEELATLYGHSAAVNAVAITPNGQFVVSGAADKMVTVWAVAKYLSS